MLPRDRRPPAALPAALILVLAVAACDDPFAAFLGDVPLMPTETTLFDYQTARIQDPPAFDIVRAVPASEIILSAPAPVSAVDAGCDGRRVVGDHP